MILYPINLDVAGKPCVVVGGGKVALRKILGLLEAGARVNVIAPEICAGVAELVKLKIISWTQARFSADLLGDELILIAATDSKEVNRQACEAAQARKILVNAVNIEGGNFYVPSTLRRDELLLTVSTGTHSPAFARFIRQMLEEEIDERFSAGLEIMSARRREVKRLLPNHAEREIFWQEVLNRETWELLRRGKFKELEEQINHALESFGLKSHDGSD